MKRLELILSSVLISLALSGCGKTNDVSGDETPNKVVEESAGQRQSVDNDEKTIKLEFLKNLDYSEIIKLSENRFFAVNDENSIIYDENLNVIKEVGNTTIKEGAAGKKLYDGMFIYQEPYFHDGKMQYKEGLMDFDGNILYEATLIDSSNEDVLKSIIRSEGGYGDEYEYGIGYRVTESGKIELAYLQIGRDTNNLRVINSVDVLFEGDYDEIFAYSSSRIGDYMVMLPAYHPNLDYHLDFNSIAFKKDDYWGIAGLDGNVILEPEYGEIVFSHHNSNDGLDYYQVTNESGKVGIFNTNGWVIEPTFSYADDITMCGLYTVVYEKSTSQKTKVYNDEGELLKEFDFRAHVEALSHYSNDDVDSDEFFQVMEWEDSSNNYLFDSNFNEITLPEEIPNKYNYFYFLNDEVIFVQNNSKYYLIDTEGNLITKLEAESSEKVHWINDKYLIDNQSVYELIVE